MGMTLRSDVIHEIVNERHVFVALRTAWEECPFILAVSPRTGFIWDCIDKGYSKESSILALKEKFPMTEKAAEKLYESFVRSAVKFNYLIIDEDNDT